MAYAVEEMAEYIDRLLVRPRKGFILHSFIDANQFVCSTRLKRSNNFSSMAVLSISKERKNRLRDQLKTGYVTQRSQSSNDPRNRRANTPGALHDSYIRKRHNST